MVVWIEIFPTLILMIRIRTANSHSYIVSTSTLCRLLIHIDRKITKFFKCVICSSGDAAAIVNSELFFEQFKVTQTLFNIFEEEYRLFPIKVLCPFSKSFIFKMKFFAILAAMIGVCVAFTAATPGGGLICCPDPPLNPKFGHGPACRKCDKTMDPSE